MLHYEVTDPQDIQNPIPEDKRSEPLLAYHGTSLSYAEGIEKEGFAPNQLPYSMEDIETVNQAYERFKWFGISGYGYPAISTFTTGADKSRKEFKPISFACRYEYARNYATNPGGETIKNLMIAIKEFKQFKDNENLRNDHLTDLQEKLRRPPTLEQLRKAKASHQKEQAIKQKKAIKRAIENCQNQNLLENIWDELSKVREKYIQVFNQHKPVVYAIPARPEWFEDKPRPHAIDIPLSREIDAEHLFARIDFPNGLERVDPPPPNIENCD